MDGQRKVIAIVVIVIVVIAVGWWLRDRAASKVHTLSLILGADDGAVLMQNGKAIGNVVGWAGTKFSLPYSKKQPIGSLSLVATNGSATAAGGPGMVVGNYSIDGGALQPIVFDSVAVVNGPAAKTIDALAAFTGIKTGDGLWNTITNNHLHSATKYYWADNMCQQCSLSFPIHCYGVC